LQALGETEAERQLFVVSRRPHRHGNGQAPDPDLQRLLDRDLIALLGAVRQPMHDDRRGRVRRRLERVLARHCRKRTGAKPAHFRHIRVSHPCAFARYDRLGEEAGRTELQDQGPAADGKRWRR